LFIGYEGGKMPVITVDIGSVKFEKAAKAKLIEELTDVMHRHTGIRKEAFLVYLRESDADNVGVGGVQLSEKLKNK